MTAIAALAGCDFAVTRSYRLSFVSDIGWGVINLLVYFFISKLVTPSSGDIGSSPSYFSFVVAGLVMSLIVYAGSTGVLSRVRNDQLTGTLELLCAQPLRVSELALGVTTFPLGFGVVRAAGYLAFAALFLELDASAADWGGVVVILVVSAVAFAPIGILAAGAAIVYKRASSVAGALVYTMTFVSGAVFPISVLPGWLQSIGHAMPTWFAYEGLRSALFEGGGWHGDAAALLLFATVGLPGSIWLLTMALAKAKRDGTLGQY